MPETNPTPQPVKTFKRSVTRRVAIDAARSLKPLGEGFSYILRFSLGARIVHLIVMTCFAVLAVTGLAQAFDTTRPAQTILVMLGGLEGTQQVHHFFAIVLIAAAIYHAAVVADGIFVKLQPASMLPSGRDFANLWQMIAFNLGLSRKLPQYDRYTFDEKLVYWVTVIAVAILTLTGLVMWFPSLATQILPGSVYVYSISIHRWQAIFALVVIVFLHLYQVLVRKQNFSIFSGQMSLEEMQAEHPVELAALQSLAPYAETPKMPRTVTLQVPEVIINIPARVKTPKVKKLTPVEETPAEPENLEAAATTTPTSGDAS